jgi:hypothetical protein
VPSLLFFRTQLLQQNQRGNRLFLVSKAKQSRLSGGCAAQVLIASLFSQ